jgi:hypothetical protein
VHDYFVAAALTGFLSQNGPTDYARIEAFKLADKIMEQREERRKEGAK